MGLAETAPQALMAPTWLSDVVRSEVIVVASEAVPVGESPAPARLRIAAAIAAGGALGGLVRAAAVKLAPLHEGSWPWATFCVNIAGCLILGYAVTHLLGRRRPPLLALAFVGVGICGALTTFSTLELELARLIHDGHGSLAAAYAAATLVAGAGAIVLAGALARRRER
jgi:CrcB protein